MILDDPIADESVQNFAAQLEHVEPVIVSQLRSLLRGDQPDEFYKGLLAGFAGAYQMITKLPAVQVESSMGPILAVIAKFMITGHK